MTGFHSSGFELVKWWISFERNNHFVKKIQNVNILLNPFFSNAMEAKIYRFANDT